MEKTSRNWSKSDDISGLLGRRKIDWSSVKGAIAVPAEFYEEIKDGIGVLPKPKERILVTFRINGQVFDVKLVNTNRKDVSYQSIGFRYDNNWPLIKLLQDTFKSSHKYIDAQRKLLDVRCVVVPTANSEYIEFYKSDVPFQFDVKLVPTKHPFSDEDLLALEPAQLDVSDTQDEDELDFVEDIEISNIPINPSYSIDQLVRKTSKSQEELSKMLQAINRKQAVILYGPPGTGKTFIARELAKYLVSNTNGIIEFVQFHEGYQYEDFIQAIRPVSSNSQIGLVPGTFLNFCGLASKRTGNCVLIIDEANRGDITRILGELLSALEYRDQGITLCGGGSLTVPANIIIIGTMNSSGRKVSAMDKPLRRRFAWLKIPPDYSKLRKIYSGNTTINVDGLIKVITEINERIDSSDDSLGVSYFLVNNLSEEIESIWQTEIEPLLEDLLLSDIIFANKYRWENIKERILLNAR